MNNNIRLTKWLGPKECDLCKKKVHGKIYDALCFSIEHQCYDQYCNVCDTCYQQYHTLPAKPFIEHEDGEFYKEHKLSDEQAIVAEILGEEALEDW